MTGTSPIILYDDHCSLCTSFAHHVRTLARGNVRLVGHYSQQGIDMRTGTLDDDAPSMFWFIDKNMARGGRAALVPLLKHVITSFMRRHPKFHTGEAAGVACSASDCAGAKHVFIRSASLIRSSRTVRIKHPLN